MPSSLRFISSLVWLTAFAPLVESCRPYDPALLDTPKRAVEEQHPSTIDAGDACVPSRESCNRADDDCDGKIDEEAAAECADIILNADSDCIALGKAASCVLLSCHAGFEDCDGNPANGCEPYCTCHACSDAASAAELDAGEVDAGGAEDAGNASEDGGGPSVR